MEKPQDLEECKGCVVYATCKNVFSCEKGQKASIKKTAREAGERLVLMAKREGKDG